MTQLDNASEAGDLSSLNQVVGEECVSWGARQKLRKRSALGLGELSSGEAEQQHASESLACWHSPSSRWCSEVGFL